MVKNLFSAGDQVQSLDWEDPLEKGITYSLQYSCLENPTGRGAWWAAVHETAQSQTQLKQLSTHTCVNLDKHV